MDFFLHYTNPNHHHSSSSSSSSILVTNNKSINNSLFHGEKKRNNKRNNNMSSTKSVMKLSTDPQSVAARERRHRISERFKILRSLIPGADTRNMDTVSMLEEAIQYVKLLKAQISFHQTMISFQNFGDHDQYPHQHLPFDHIYGDNYQHLPQMGYEMLPQLGFQEGSCFKVEGQDNMVSLSHDHHHHVIYP